MSSSPCLREDLPGPRNNSLNGTRRIFILHLDSVPTAEDGDRSRVCNLNLSIQRQQSNRPIGGGESVGNVATESCHIADLRSGDQVTGFGQGLGVMGNFRVSRDAVDWDGGSDEEFVTNDLETSSSQRWKSHLLKFERARGVLVRGRAKDRFPRQWEVMGAALLQAHPWLRIRF